MNRRSHTKQRAPRVTAHTTKNSNHHADYVIYIRSEVENLQTFEKQIFHERYHRREDHSTDIPGRPNDVADDDDFDFTPDAIELNSNQMDESDEFETNALSDRQKYKIVMPYTRKDWLFDFLSINQSMLSIS